MKKILIFSGTSEGRKLAEFLSEAKISSIVSVATEYGKTVMEENEYITVREGRMNESEMEQFLAEQKISIVIDATHPFATEVSQNIKAVTAKQNLPYLRLKRNTRVSEEAKENCRWFADTASCAKALKKTTGKILLTTGSKELKAFAEEIQEKDRLFVRVLPSVESLSICQSNGIMGKQVIAMQGPFTEQMNEALLQQYHIDYLVTKETGKSGGFFEKISAAEKCGITTFVIGNPETESGYEFLELLKELEKLLQISFGKFEGKETTSKFSFHLIGMGMGNAKSLTKEAEEALQEADIVFGAKRLLAGIDTGRRKVPYYRAEDILKYLKTMPETFKIAVVFSGDTGFYSGAERFCQEIGNEHEIKIYPGVSSLSYFAGRLHMSWQDVKIVSLHGQKADILQAVRENKKTFFLLSGAEDVREIGQVLAEQSIAQVRIHVGYQLSYPEEEVFIGLTPKECRNIEKPGLYVCLVENEEIKTRTLEVLTPGIPDAEFVRAKVPMTKEAVREVSLCKLRLTPEAVVYDVGSGTGSISIECARLSPHIQVIALERKEAAVALLKENQKKFALSNITCIRTEAPQGLENLPVPTHAFIGGSGGNLKEILKALYQKNPKMRIVVNAVTLETIGELMDCLHEFPVTDADLTQLQVSKAELLGSCHLMKAGNPVLIAAFQFC